MSTALTPEVISPRLLLTANLDALTLRQKSLVDIYLEEKVLWKAAELAGYTGSHQTLCQTARETLNKPEVKAYYEQRLQELAISSSEVLAELAEIARYSLSEMGEKSPVRTSDKLKALELVGKYHKLFTDRVESDLDIDVSALANLLRAVCERARAMQVDQVALGGPMDQVGQVGQLAVGSDDGLSGGLSSSAIIDITPENDE